MQGCVRTVDIESVGDPTHFTFFEMMGNWSLGDYFKKEKTQCSYDLLTKVFGMDGKEICSTVFEGNDECLLELPLQGLAKLVNLVVIFRGSYRIFKQSALLIAGGVRVTFQPSVACFQTGTAGQYL